MDFAAAISSVGSMLQIANTAVQARDDAKAKQAIADVQMKLFELSTAALGMTEKNMALVNEIRDLQEKIRDFESKATERDSYVLVQINGGAWAYKYKFAAESSVDESPHFCQPCYDKDVKSVLRKSQYGYGGWYFSCPEDERHQIELGS